MRKRRLKTKNRTLYKISAFAAVVLLLASAFVMSSQSVSSASAGNYTLSIDPSGKTLVKDSGGRTTYSSSASSTAIQWAIDHTSSGGIVTLKDAKYTLSGKVNLKSGITLTGSGSSTILVNGGINVPSVSDVALKSFSMQGTCSILISASIADIKNVVVQDVSADKVGGVSAVYKLDVQKHNASGIKFIRVSTQDAGTYGFLVVGSGKGTAMVKDITFDSCKAIRSGLNVRVNDWVVGFALAVNVDVTNMYVQNSESSYNWENGFYFRSDVTKTNVVLENNVASYNGQKPNYQEGYGYLVDQTVILKSCTGTGNKGGLTNIAPAPPPAPVASTVSIILASTSVQVGMSMHADGLLKGTDGISGATVSLQVTLPDGSIAYPTQGATVITDASGKFAMDYVATETGTYKFTASFGGDSMNAPSSMTVTLKS
jgi:hypothetical protein